MNERKYSIDELRRLYDFAKVPGNHYFDNSHFTAHFLAWVKDEEVICEKFLESKETEIVYVKKNGRLIPEIRLVGK